MPAPTPAPPSLRYRPAAYNVIAGWLGCEIPPIPKQRNLTRAGYRKTARRRLRGSQMIETRPRRRSEQLTLL